MLHGIHRAIIMCVDYIYVCVCILPLGCSHWQQVVHNSNAHGRDHRRQRSPEQAHLLTQSKAMWKQRSRWGAILKWILEKQNVGIWTFLIHFILFTEPSSQELRLQRQNTEWLVKSYLDKRIKEQPWSVSNTQAYAWRNCVKATNSPIHNTEGNGKFGIIHTVVLIQYILWK